MLTAVGQYVGSKVLSAVLFLGVLGAGIWFWKHPEQLATIWMVVRYALAWIGFVLVLPWATFFVTPWVVRKESNATAACMLIGYALIDALAAWWLLGSIRGHGVLIWFVLLLGILGAAIYNLKVCEFQARRVEEAI